ncbi:MAG: glycogen-binding domain-containing protein [Desulfovibrionaceae bacterium]
MTIDSKTNLTREQAERLALLLRDLPEIEPDAGFTARVTTGLKPLQPSLWTRLRLWATQPLRLTLTPARIAPAAALFLAAILLFWPGSPETTPLPENADPISAPVRFVLHDPGSGVASVAVIGSFNNWKSEGYEMRYDEQAKAWILEAPLPPGSHEYVFLLDGRTTRPDPEAAFSKDDGFGQRNSILMVGRNDAI